MQGGESDIQRAARLADAMTVTAANVHDITQAAALSREDDEVVYGDSGYLGIQKRPEVAGDDHLSGIDYRINRRPGEGLRLAKEKLDEKNVYFVNPSFDR